MKQKLSVAECRPYLLGILKHVDKFCRINNIQYSLGYGTLIGAIRHKGFIPWDDDIDIIMTRENYDKFLSLYRNDDRYKMKMGNEIANHLHVVVTDDRTRLEYPEGTTDHLFYEGGLRIDLFPMDNVIDDADYFHGYKKITRLRKLQLQVETGHVIGRYKLKMAIMRILHPMLKKLSLPITMKMERIMRRNNLIKTEYVASYTVWYWRQRIVPKDYLSEFVEVDFEGNKFFAIKEYDKYLRGLYGDYMQYPPEDERVPKHNFEAFLIK